MIRVTHPCITIIPRKIKCTGIRKMTTITKEPNLTNMREDRNLKLARMFMRESLKNQERGARFRTVLKIKGFMRSLVMDLKFQIAKKSVK